MAKVINLSRLMTYLNALVMMNLNMKIAEIKINQILKDGLYFLEKKSHQ